LKNHDWEWLQKLWESYLKLKYKKALQAFSKRTGGGSGTKFDMHDYCDRRHRMEFEMNRAMIQRPKLMMRPLTTFLLVQLCGRRNEIPLMMILFWYLK
jgi:hypothetical protein